MEGNGSPLHSSGAKQVGQERAWEVVTRRRPERRGLPSCIARRVIRGAFHTLVFALHWRARLYCDSRRTHLTLRCTKQAALTQHGSAVCPTVARGHSAAPLIKRAPSHPLKCSKLCGLCVNVCHGSPAMTGTGASKRTVTSASIWDTVPLAPRSSA